MFRHTVTVDFCWHFLTVRTPRVTWRALDDADALVAGDERQRRLDLPVAARGVDVRVTETGGLDADEHLLGPGFGRRDLLDLERRACSHGRRAAFMRGSALD